jgi:hypothetical protein
MQVVVLAKNFTTKNNKYFLRTFNKRGKVENLLSFCLKICNNSTKASLNKDDIKTK